MKELGYMHPNMNDGRIFRNWMFSDFEGVLLTVIESFGMKESQENAAKSQIRKAVWELWNSTDLIIPNETNEVDGKIMSLIGRDMRDKTVRPKK